MAREFEFENGPDKMTAKLRHFEKPDGQGRSAYIAFTGKGPRGGFVSGTAISAAAFRALDDMLSDALDLPYRCHGCGRPEDDCSRDPCGDVVAEREA